MRRTSSTLFAEMHPAAGHAILVATINELAALSLSTAGGAHVIPWIPETERRVVAVEMEPDSTNAVEREIEPALAKALRDPWVVYVYDQDRGREARQPAAIKPAGIAEIAEVAVKMQRPLRPTTPPATPNAPR